MKDDRLIGVCEEIRVLRDEKKALEEKIHRAQVRVLKEFERRGIEFDEFDTDDPATVLRVTRVQQEVVTYSPDEAQDVLTSKEFRAVTKPVVDKQLLEEQVLAGSISLAKVKKFSKVTPRSPFVKVTEVKRALH